MGCAASYDDRAKKIELYTQIAETYAEQIEDQEKALDAYLAIGDTLDVVIRRRAPLGVAEALRLLTPVAAALDAAWDLARHWTMDEREALKVSVC